MTETESRLRARLSALSADGLCIAFSGGIDSSLLLKLACEVSDSVRAVLFSSQLMPVRDREIAERVARECGTTLEILQLDVTKVPEIMENRKDRCYHCKKMLFSALRRWCDERGISNLCDGTNADDLTVYRPGRRALKELSVCSPLAELGISKQEVRQMAETLGLSVAKRPSAPCMATRLPYDTHLELSVLRRLEEGEEALRALGFPVCRLRLHGDVVRLELPPDRFSDALAQRDVILSRLSHLNFPYLTLDLTGFRSGSMDEEQKHG